NGEVTEPVPALNPAYFTIPEDAFQEISSLATNEMIEPLKHRISFRPGVEGSAFSGFQGGVGGYVGVFLESRMSPRFSLMTGFGYRSFSPGASLFNGQKVLTNADGYNGNALLKSDTLFTGIPTYVPSETVNSASYHDLDPIIESVDQWQARLGIAWNASKHFYAEGGYGFAFKTQAYSQFPIVAYDYTSSISNIKVSHTFNQYDVIRTTMSSVYLGLGYRIGHHLSLDLKWLHTFQPYVLSNSSTIAAPNGDTGGRNDIIRGLSLGANWKM
ncbi:MAG TPA: hypothetical protein VJ508_12045, partial [Saprospiraceae bacterium]|nr:hypothetical protein [Saprospiraceae bacterium]